MIVWLANFNAHVERKKAISERIVYSTDLVEHAKEDPVKVFKRALDNIKPAVGEILFGGANFKCLPGASERQSRFGLAGCAMLLVKGERTMRERLANDS